MNAARRLMDVMGFELELRRSAMQLEAIIGHRIFTEDALRKCFDYAERVHAHFYTAEELDALAAFYSSPVGLSLLRKMPIVQRLAMRAGQAISEGREPDPLPAPGAP